MNAKKVVKRKTFFLLVLAFFLVFFAFSLFTVLTGIISFGEVDSWDGETIATTFSSGNGTEENPYVINGPEEFLYFKSLVEGDNYQAYQDKIYKLSHDIDFGEHEITPIGIVNGEEERIFKGTFLGNGYTLKNFIISTPSVFQDGSYYSLFSKVEEGSISEVNLENYRITSLGEYDKKVMSGVVGNLQKGTIQNISLSQFSMLGENTESSIIAYKSEESTFKNLYVNGEVQSSHLRFIENGEIYNVISNITYDGEISDFRDDFYRIVDQKVYLGDEEILDSDLLSSLNSELSFPYYWKLENGVLKILTREVNAAESPNAYREFSFSIQNSSDITLHATGHEGTSLYLNDLDSDKNYYIGRNYTEITNTNGVIPDGENHNLYSDSNLAIVYIRYSSADFNDSNVYGAVSVSEDYRDIYYYKRIPVVNGYIEFDLIDSPWGRRPNNRAFNGWVTDYTGAVVSLDMDTYTRSVRVPVNNVSSPISITFYSSWTNATVVESYDDLDDLRDVEMVSLTSYSHNMSTLYVYGTVAYRGYYPNSNNLYSLAGNKINSGARCNANGGCTYVDLNTAGTYNPNSQYYTVTGNGNNKTVTRVYPTVTRGISYYTNGGTSAGYFKHVTNGTTNIYSATGQKLTSCGGSCYQLLQYSDGAINANDDYYYLVTRDTNIYAPSETTEVRNTYMTTDVPMTITGIHNGVDRSANRTIRLYSDWTINSDIRIEHITFYANNTTTNVTNIQTNGYEIIGNFHNMKLGRGLRRNGNNITASSFIGGANAATSSLQKYQTIVESGYYQTGSGVGYSGDRTHYVNADIILGSDVDRALEDDDNLIVYYCYAGSWASSLYNSADTSNTYDFPSIYTRVKSGSFGENHGDYAAGVYAGGRGSGSHYSLREVLVEGGKIYNLIGGPMSNASRAGKNDVIINVKGGTITMVFGGAGASNTVGNRILNITGGTIEYGILGGSNAYIEGNSSDPYGKIDGDTLIYVGGGVTVGNKSDSLYYVDSGNIFGAGNGRRGELDVGSVNNSHVIIAPGANVTGSVYGGGNFGAVGGSISGNSSTPIVDTPSGVYEDSTTDRNIRYFGSDPDNYIRFNGENYRIIGLFNNVSTNSGNKNLVRIIKNSSATTRAWGDSSSSTVATNNTTETTSGWFANNTYNYTNYYKNYYNYFVKNNGTMSPMYNYLNTNYYGTINSTYQNYIQSVNWGLGSASSNNLSAASFYTSERGNGVVNYLTGVNQTGNGSSASSYDFRIGLFYPSDYGFANNTDACMANLGSYSAACRNGNWLKYISNAWTMSPSTDVYSVTREYQVSSSGNFWNGYTYTMNRYYHTVNRNFILGTNSIDLRDIYYTGNDNDANNYYNTNAVYPSFYLKEDVTISGGSGTADDPYIIGNSEDTLVDVIYQLAHPESGDDPTLVEDDGVYHDPNDYQARTRIHVIGGTISGSIYGAGNNNGAGNKDDDDNIALAKVQIDIDGGSIGESVYGGSNEFGRLYGDVLLNVNNGTISGSVYGGGKGGSSNTSEGTFVSRNIDVNIGSDSTTNLTIGHNVYGGSAYGVVNGEDTGEPANSNYVRVKVSNGTITGSVFGGGEGDSSHEPEEYGNIFVHINGGSITNVFGGNDSSGSPSAADVVYLNGGTIGNAYGGGNNTGQDTTDIRLQGSTISGNIYGGSNVSGNVSSSRVSISSGSCVEAFGGNNLGGTCDTTNVRVTGGTISSAVYGGGKQAESSTTTVQVLSCGVNDVYGGGKQAGVSSGTNVTLTSATAVNVFGGSNVLGTVTESHVQVEGSTVTSLYGGNNAGGSTTTTNVTTETSTIGSLFGGGDNASSTTSHVLINSGTITNVYGGGNEAGLTTSNVEVYGGVITNLFGGSNTSGDITASNVTVGHEVIEQTIEKANVVVQVSKRAPGNYPQSTKPTYAVVNVTVNNLTEETIDDWEIALNVPSSELFANYSNSNITISGDTYSVDSVNRYYGYNSLAPNGSYNFSFEILSDVELNDFEVTGEVIRPATIHISNSVPITVGNLYGGNNLGGSTSAVHIQALDGQINNLFGGGNEATVGSVNAVVDHVTSANIYGGGNEAAVTGNVLLDVDHTSISGNLYGGGNEGAVQGKTEVMLTDSTVLGNVFAGGNGEAAIVYGDTSITIDGKVKVGSESTVAPHAGCVFGSGNAATTGRNVSHSNATVNIVGGEIFGNVYGGPKMAVVYGTTNTNIGTSAVNLPGLKEDDIIIHGTVFGGGESNAEGSESYDYTFISVTDGIDVTINGSGYENHDHKFIINGSIFGSGNASSSSGTSNITIKNLGSMTKPNQAISIQRASNLVIDASVIELFGTTDRTNEFSDIFYSFNMIDKMIIKNNTTLLLQHNANLLKEVYSGVDVNGALTKAAVEIDDTGITSMNVNNRIYMTPGQNLNIAVNATANAYGRVSGMTFFGMYTTNENNAYRFGLYDPSYSHGDSGNASLEIVGGSYVIGLRNDNHDITVDGFYTNSLDSESHNSIVTAYIDPTQIGETGYRWNVGFEAIEYTVDLTVSKYSSFGTAELSMIDFADGDTIFTILGCNTTELDSNIDLVDSNEIPRVALTETDANRLLGLSIKAETQEWTSAGTTKFLSSDGGDFTGVPEYSTDSRKIAPSLMFYSYHPKNFQRVGNLGKVVISMQVAIPKNAIDYDIKFVTITVTIVSRDYNNGVYYDASISYDKKYEMPAATSVNITNQSQFTTYFSLTEFFDEFKDIYGIGNTNYHVITFSDPLPVDTVITMLDFGTNPNRPEYYYYRVTQADYTRTMTEISLYGEASYPLSGFIKMDSTSTNNTYNDAAANLIYYNATTHLVVEEFIFIIDFKETTRTGTHLGCHASIELRNSDGWSTINVVASRDALMDYNTYDSSNVVLSQVFANVDEYLYYNVPDEFNYSTNILYNETQNRQPVIDTNYEYSSMGLNVVFYDRTGALVRSSLLAGTSITIGNHEYFADVEGIYRIKLAGKVSNIIRDAQITVGEKLPAGSYTIRYTLFASEDGLHNSTYQNSVYQDIEVVVVSNQNYISVDCSDGAKLVYGETGLNHDGDDTNTYTINYRADLAHPAFRVMIYKRNTDTVDSTVYEPVTVSTLFDVNYTTSENTIILTVTEEDSEDFEFPLASDLTSGTYRLDFMLYDGNQLIDEDSKYVIVQKKLE